MRGVLSHDPSFATLGQMWIPLVFHTVVMMGGVGCLQAAARRRAAGSPAATA